MQGFRKVDPDRWEFANEGFLGGQKHLLKTIKRRRNPSQNMQQEGGSSVCVELGQYGLEEDQLETLRKDRNVLMSEIISLRQHQQNSRDKVIAMEERIRSTERKQQQIMSFLVKALHSPSFVQQYLDKYAERGEQRGIEIRRKRRLTMSPSVESLFTNQEEELGNIEEEIEMETLFSAALDKDSSSEIVNPNIETIPITSGTGLDYDGEIIWEDFLAENVLGGNEEGEVLVGDESEVDVEVEDLEAEPLDWGEDFQDLVDQMGFLRSIP